MEFDLTSITKFIDSIDKHNQKAMRSAAQRCMTAIRKEAFSIIRARYPKVARSKQKYNVPSFNSLTGERKTFNMSNLEIAFNAAARPFNASYTIVGSPKPRNQRGIARSARPAIFKRVEGKKEKARSGHFLFQKNGIFLLGWKGPNKKGETVIAKETYSSIHQVLSFRENEKRLTNAFDKTATDVYEKFHD